jgi:hypothetical protein
MRNKFYNAVVTAKTNMNNYIHENWGEWYNTYPDDWCNEYISTQCHTILEKMAVTCIFETGQFQVGLGDGMMVSFDMPTTEDCMDNFKNKFVRRFRNKRPFRIWGWTTDHFDQMVWYRYTL